MYKKNVDTSKLVKKNTMKQFKTYNSSFELNDKCLLLFLFTK